MSSAIIWFRQDLRLDDNPALSVAVKRGLPVIPLYIWSPGQEGSWATGAASRWWLHHSLVGLDQILRQAGSRLIIRRGNALRVIETLVRETNADAVYWNRCYEPAAIKKDDKLETLLVRQGLEIKTFNSSLLFEPWQIHNKQGQPFRVFTPYFKTCLALPEPPKPISTPSRLPTPKKWPQSLSATDIGLLPKIDWAKGIESAWTPGEKSAQQTLNQFLKHGLVNYETDRDRPDLSGTSRLSPYLHWGQISPRQIWYAIKKVTKNNKSMKLKKNAQSYLRQLVWREFAHHLLYYFPHTIDQPLHMEFSKFPWKSSTKDLRSWQQGRTGYPLVDAGMRELLYTGWMHNRVRMVVASFLVKHLLIRWQEGAKWFWDTLVDADLANNTFGWQWSAGCGADAAPYFRIFNPVLQAKKFDPNSDYVRQWVPEISALPDKYIHSPWNAPSKVLADAGMKLGRTYPRPIVDHTQARQRALTVYQQMKKRRENK
ncbi:MAG: cryptochrome/photolyase family protein [Planctomycetota bacterium]|jgi:deoxyribodipyrimidine photo-lyase